MSIPLKKKGAGQGARQFEAVRQEKEARERSGGAFFDIDKIRPKNWSKIKATHIDTLCRRYQIVKEEGGMLWCWVKLPSSDMILQGCTNCSGPHSVANTKCWANTRTKSHQFIPPNALMDMNTGELHPSRFIFDNVVWNEGQSDIHRAGRMILKTM